ncbi:probable LRR receptor-like serine/threonine-protein kinase At1g51810 [Aegilops tauschii subsp. strangulata]|uniref:Putative LRR receptor-like serine/threonine-protein kinase n=1 Tax=Aegilops tauschii TaxID=37682 RepID=M8CA57_AEGTA
MVISPHCSAISIKPTWNLALLLILVMMMIRVHGQSSTSGFISIDCGNNGTYNDSITGLQYHSDDGFVEGGLSHKISTEFMADAASEQAKTLRSFPDGSRNCYTLPSIIGKKYLLRALFSYGDYDGLNRTLDGSPFLFGLHIGVNFWDTVNLTYWNPSITAWKEVLTVAPGDSMSVCLINFGTGTPFVSVLELRPLLDAMYPFVNTSVSVGYFGRIRFDEVADFITRYPVDPYDRFWEGWSSYHNTYPWINLNTSSQVEILPGDDYFNVPMAIFQKATTLDANYYSMWIGIEKDNVDSKSVRLLPIFHFAEINGSNPNRRNLSTSGLKGGLTIAFMNMVSLENLDLSHNNLTGGIPDYQIKSIKVLDLSYNQLDGPIPHSILQRYQAGLLDLRFACSVAQSFRLD